MRIDPARPRRGTPAAMAVIALLVVGLTGWIVVNSAFFEIHDVRVEGARNVSEDEVRRLADIPSDANLIMLPLDDVASRLEAHPWVLHAQVLRDLPTTAVIRVIERTPGGWMKDAAGIAILAGDGTVLQRVTHPPAWLPEIGDSSDTLVVGERILAPSQTLRVAASMGGPLRRRVAALELEGSEIVLRLRAGGTVLYGEPLELSAKNQALAELLRWANGEGIPVQTIDVRAPAAPSLEPLRKAGAPPATRER